MFGTNTLLNMAALLFAGLLFSRLIKLLKLPNVTGFLVGGLIIGPLFWACSVHKGWNL